MNDHLQLAQTLNQYVQRSGYAVSRLARLTGIPHPTLVNWLSGRVQRPRYWDALVRLAAVLGLNEEEASILLQSAGHPSIRELLGRVSGGEEKALLAPWAKVIKEEQPAPFQAIADLPYFVARESLLEDIKQAILNKRSTPICSLQGMAGAGKTTLAARIAYLLSPHFTDGVLWARVDLSDTMSILSVFAAAYDRDVSQYTDVASRSQFVRMLLAGKRALIVLDNVQRSEEVRPLIPSTGSCAVIITTRRHDLAVSRGIHRFIVGPFGIEGEESMLLFAELLGQERVQREYAELSKIAELVGHLPLAIAIVAGRLAYEHNWSATQFIQRLRQEKKRLNELSYEDQDVVLSFELSYEVLPEEQQQFFAALSVFGGEDFSVEAAAAITQLPEETAHDVLRKLHGISLVQAGREQRYRLHPLLRDYARKKLSDDSLEEAMIDYFVQYTLAYRLDAAVMRRERGNIEYALKSAFERGQFAAFVRGVNVYYRFLLATGSLDAAEEYLLKAQQVGRRVDDQSHAAVSLHYLGQISEKRGNPVQAEKYFRQALELAQRAEAGEVIGGVLINLGILSARQGKSDEAEAYWHEALDYSSQYEKHENVCAILSNLGALATIRGDYPKASVYYERGLETADKWGHEQRKPNLFINLGTLTYKQGDVGRARALYEEALKISRKLDYVHEISVSLQSLGEVAQYGGNYRLAKEYYEASLELLRPSQLKHRMSQVLACLGEVLWLEGDVEGGKSHISEALALARSIEGAINHTTTIILNKWGELQLAIGQLEAAHEAFTESLSIAAKVGSQELMALALFGLSKVSMEKGDVVAAREKGRESLDMLAKLGHMEAVTVQKWLDNMP